MPDNLKFFVSLAAKAALLAAMAITLWFAFAPPHGGAPLLPWDKAEHVLAFFTLSTLALAAFPRIRPVWLAAALSLLGALIEIIQGTPLVNRDCDVWDWVADTVAVLAVMGVLAVVHVRAWLAGPRT